MSKSILTRIQNKHDFEINWQNATFAPLEGEIIVYDSEVDAEGKIKTFNGKSVLPEGRTAPYSYTRFKIGDGVTPVNDLPFAGNNISCGTTDPDATTLSQFYFKYL